MEPEQPHPPRHGLVARWEALPARRQFAAAYLAAAAILLVGHMAFFQRITVGRSIGYAIFEALPFALLVVFATQTEIARRRGSGGGSGSGSGGDGGRGGEPPPAG